MNCNSTKNEKSITLKFLNFKVTLMVVLICLISVHMLYPRWQGFQHT